ncbi:topoisomerase via, partial [Cystoisospora suis]
MVTFRKGLDVLDCRRTGKGFPDFATRKLLRHLRESLGLEVITPWSCQMEHPILQHYMQCAFLGDFDPHGLSIYISYSYGSMAFEGPSTACPGLHWLGMCYEDLKMLPDGVHLPLSARDTSLLTSLLRHPAISQCPRLREQCLVMSNQNIKFEIEALSSLGLNYLARYYIPLKILKRTW